MGTQSSYGGPGDRQPLLPSWALDPVVPAGPDDGSADSDSPSPTPAQPAVPQPQTTPAPRTQRWNAARRSISSVVRSGGGGGRMGRAARRYVSAKGGARKAARAAKSGRRATAALGGFLGDVARSGFREAAVRLGIAALLGNDAQTVFAAIIDAIAPDGATSEGAAARRAVSDSLWQLYDRYSLDTADLSRLDSMDVAAVREALEASITTYVYTRWLQEVGIKIEEWAMSEAQAVRRERDVKAYVQDLVRLDFQEMDVLSMDWTSRKARDFVERQYVAAYSVFEVT